MGGNRVGCWYSELSSVSINWADKLAIQFQIAGFKEFSNFLARGTHGRGIYSPLSAQTAAEGPPPKGHPKQNKR